MALCNAKGKLRDAGRGTDNNSHDGKCLSISIECCRSRIVLITALMTENVEQSVMDAIASGHGMVQIRSSGMEAKAGMKRAIDEGTDIRSSINSALSEVLPAKTSTDDDTPIRMARSAVSLVSGNKVPIPQNASVGMRHLWVRRSDP